MAETSALADAIARSFACQEPRRAAVSPLHALGRRQLSGWEVLAQSVATTAPAASMVLLPVTMLNHRASATNTPASASTSGLIAIVTAAVFVTMIAWCTTQFTRRMVASGGLYAFVAKGLGARAALVTGIAMAVKYLVSGALSLYSGGLAVITIAALCGVEIRGPATLTVYLGIAAAILVALVRGVRFAALAILVIEVCSLVFIIGLMMVAGGESTPVQPLSGGGTGMWLPVVLAALFALAGFESATFIGPEARRPMVTVTRTVLATPIICGTLFVFAGWAAWSGHADAVVGAYLHGTSTGVSPVVVALLHIGMCCSWLASAMASSNAVSRLLYSMGVEGVLPRILGTVHSRLCTPYAALATAVTVLAIGASVLAVFGSRPDWINVTLRVALLIAYVLVAASAVAFLARIRESTPAIALMGGLGTATGVAVIGFIVAGHVLDGRFAGLIAVVAVPVIAMLWYRYLSRARPASLADVGIFDSPGSEDVLPGSAAFAENARGDMALVGADHPGAEQR
ncbi:APC family permease [Rhodococcus sp. HNM0563]|uniref:APC family permease n=1 Tax=unclassified Rhodococcus (in: high G+C Gram-positive bacteria) TaxID=192944 RepID=UPI00146D29E0|nr:MULTISPECIES: APC family permease [unclassified Rhodococcus (in: high G+C Gram-positive bacteria)]MCK0090352.1 APC family permease [Rhodococcus sp. F64268]NLU61561.1 APC family permease [Rhodococcus sp. HNM0563]